MNLYAYCGNDPVNCVDPTGLTSQVSYFNPKNPKDWVQRLAVGAMGNKNEFNAAYGHGNAVSGLRDDINGVPLTAKEVADAIRGAPGYEANKPTLVLGCNVGRKKGYCGEIAKHLGSSAGVFCPDDFVWFGVRYGGPGTANPVGSFGVFPYAPGPGELPWLKHPGNLLPFYPWQ